MTGPHLRLYISAAFIAGVLVTISIDFDYSFLKFRSLPWFHDRSSLGRDADGLVEDRKKENKRKTVSDKDIRDGIEECIGNTPLVRIKSLSRATGCDILAKAEVRLKWLQASIH